jgi:aryl-alcohol dehydrogenase-like predicted oxidoreductase
VKAIQAIARDKHCTTAQLALAWVLAQGSDIVPIPGTRRIGLLEENIGALEIQLDQTDFDRINDFLPPDAAAGTRYAVPHVLALNR